MRVWLTFQFSSAHDQITGQAVAIKKVIKPFETATVAKRTFREVKLLKHFRHENVWQAQSIYLQDAFFILTIYSSSVFVTFLSLHWRTCKYPQTLHAITLALTTISQIFSD